MNVKIMFTSLVTGLLLSQAAFALSLQDAKQQGLVGEQVNGYLGVIKVTNETTTLVNQVNTKRKQKYQDIAKRNGASLEAVERIAGQKAINKTPVGQFINVGSRWQKK